MRPGILLVDKPAGITSAKVVSIVKRQFDLDRVGHAGTLDPMATGLLVVLCGEATRLARFAEGGEKIYSGSIRFGLVTSTDDIEGEVLATSENYPSHQSLLDLRTKFIGEIDQKPPRISALHVNGERAYKLARENKEFELASRKVFVKSFELFASEDSQSTIKEIKFKIHCSKGTYIRSIARDLGELAGTGACLSSLRREFSAPFSVQHAHLLEAVKGSCFMPWTSIFKSEQRVQVSLELAKSLQSGDFRALNEFGRLALECYGSVSTGQVCIYQSVNGAGGVLSFNGRSWVYEVNIPTEKFLAESEEVACHL